MITMAWTAVVALALTSPVADDAAKKDQEAMQGEWKLVSGERGGEKLPPDGVTVHRTVKGNESTVKVESGEGNQEWSSTFTLNPGAQPKEVDFKGISGPLKDQTVLGIYEIDGDILKVCIGQPGEPRPKKFSGDEGTFTTWKRVKK